jgi:putative effector of murein hydrolase
MAGKISMSLIITYFGEAVGQAFTENWIFAVITTILLVLVVIAMFKIDWEKLVKRYLPKDSKKRRR